MSSRVVAAALVTVAAAGLAGSGPGHCQQEAPSEEWRYTETEDGAGWSIWQGQVVRWRSRGALPPLVPREAVRDRGGELEQIATIPCPGLVFTGGQLHAFDLDGDARPDLAFGNWPHTTYVYAAPADNQLLQVHQVQNPVGSYATELIGSGDGDSDGLAELVFGAGTSGVPRDLYVVESQGPGLYPDATVLVLPEQDIGVNHLRVADLDGDGLREYVGTTQGTHQMLLAIWESRGDNAVARVYSRHFGSQSAISGEMVAGDLDGDGRGDLAVVVNDTWTSSIHILESTGDDAYEEVWSATLPTENAYWVTPGPDLDRDGRGDIVVTGGVGYPTADWSFLMYEADGDNSLRLAWSYHTQAAVIDAGCATGDVDGDDHNELLCQVPDRTRVFRAAGDDDLAVYWEHPGPVVGQGEHRIVAPDLDGDGYGEAIWWTTDDPGTAVVWERTAAVFADGFETGDPSEWTAWEP